MDSIVQNHIGHLMMFVQNNSLYRSKRSEYSDKHMHWLEMVNVQFRFVLGLSLYVYVNQKGYWQLNIPWWSGIGDGFRI